MGKLIKGVVRFSVAVATVGGVCYAFKDKIKASNFYKEHDIDTKINKVTTTIKEKIPFNNEEDLVEEDELFFDDDAEDASARDYVTLQTEEASENTENEAADDAATEEVPTIDL